MDDVGGFGIVMVIAIILFARLGMRLLLGWNNKKREDEESAQK